jgi:hypothetical protein
MGRRTTIEHRFVESAPEQLEDGILYVSIKYKTALQRCLCGCGNEVVTPIRPTDWTLSFDGNSVSLDPSIGNWGLPCRSHYWIEKNMVRWAAAWSKKEIEEGRDYDRLAKSHYYVEGTERPNSQQRESQFSGTPPSSAKKAASHRPGKKP